MSENLRDFWPAFLAAGTGLVGWLFGSTREGARHTAEITAIREQLAHLENRLAVADNARGDIGQRLARIEGQLEALRQLIEATTWGRK